MHVNWSNDLRHLADLLATQLEQETVAAPAEVFARKHCIVLPNQNLRGWLQQHILYDRPTPTLRVVANLDTPMLYQFVNDWLFWMKHPTEKRDAAAHPFSIEAMQWRLFSILRDPTLRTQGDLAPLMQFLQQAGTSQASQQRRTIQLAAKLARLFDDYQIYRPDVLLEWQAGRHGDLPASRLWQPALWRALTRGPWRARTYLQSFRDMQQELGRCAIAAHYPAIHLFGVSMMPQVYISFFSLLADILPVHLYLFNPCRQLWDQSLTPRQATRLRLDCRLHGREEPGTLLACQNPLLADMGRGCRNLLAEILDATGGQVDDHFTACDGHSLLARLQAGVLDDQQPDDAPASTTEATPSIQVHICHSPMREMEVLRDQIYQWFADDLTLQPRHIQVLVPDMESYGPYIDAVFASDRPLAPATLPYAVSDRRTAGQNAAAAAFDQLLQLPESRFSAPEVMELLAFESIHLRFGIDERDLVTLRQMIDHSGIRWGLDPEQREGACGVRFDEQTTWQHGLDRLLIGYALTRSFASPQMPLPCDCVEDDSALLLGKWIRFVDELQRMATGMRQDRTPADWTHWLTQCIDRFFLRTPATYADIAGLHLAAQSLAVSSEAAAYEQEVSIEVIRDLLANQISSASGSDNTNGNKVLFSSLRTGSAAPRPYICLVGIGDGCIPRPDNRPAYDLLRQGSRFGDPSLRTADRAAFLEAFMAARRHLHISYVGLSTMDNQSLPPATVLNQLLEYAATAAATLPTIQHKLHPFHPAYFTPTSGTLQSFDPENLIAARAVLKADDAHRTPPPPDDSAAPPPAQAQPVHQAAQTTLALDALIQFFKNPARAFYTQTLKVRLEDRDATDLNEEEEFSPKSLKTWQIHQGILLALCEGTHRDKVYRLLCEQGLVPLAAWGRAWFAARWLDIEQAVHQSSRHDPRPVLTFLQNQQPLWPEPICLTTTDACRILGNVQAIRTDEPHATALDYRYGKPRAHEALASWIRHLFACASATPEIRICLQDKTDLAKSAIMDYAFPVLPQETARRHMDTLVRIYVQGMHARIPFTPGTAFAYLAAEQANNKTPTGKRPKAPKDPMDAAQKAWFSSDFSFNDDQDPYYRAAFGETGPFEQPGFVPTAEAIFGPLFQAIEPGEPDHA